MFFCSVSLLCAQSTTKFRGTVTDADTGEPMKFVSVTFPGTIYGTTTDANGIYNYETRQNFKEIMAMFIGYESQTKPVVVGAFNTIDFKLKSGSAIEKVVVMSAEDPAKYVLRQVLANKDRNNPEAKESYAYDSYTKMELDITNMRPQFKNRKMQENFGFVFDYMDTSAVTGKRYLPVMISESTSEYYFRRTPNLSREVIKASRISGFAGDNGNFSQFTGQLYFTVNIYDNFHNIFGVNFVSPLNNQGLLYYKYYLVDTRTIDGRKTYILRFEPRGVASPSFEGQMNVDALTWGVSSYSMVMSKGVNVNWVHSLSVENENQLMNDTTWFYRSNKMVADLSISTKDSSKIESFMAQRQIDYLNVRIDQPIPAEIEALEKEVVVDNASVSKNFNNEEYWKQARPYELSAREQGIYTMVEQIKEAPLFQTIYDVINTVLTGYYEIGEAKKFEIGPYAKLFSHNKYEGSRFQLGLRTTPNFNKKMRLSAYGAYGLDDKEFKGGGSVEYIFERKHFSKLTVSGRHDVLQLGASEGLFSTGNILSTMLSRGNNEKLTLVDKLGVTYEKEWAPWVTNYFGLNFTKMSPTPYVDFLYPDGGRLKHLKTTEVTFGTRLSKGEVSFTRAYDKMRGGSKYPVLGLGLTAGLKDALGGEYEYYRAEASLDYSFKVGTFGKSTFIISGGKIFGDVPYPLLKLHEGNSTYIYNKRAYSCMEFYEFASDVWGEVFWEHHFRGAFLGRIPLLKKLKWREVVTCKALWGSLSDDNNATKTFPGDTRMMFPAGLSEVGSKPYVEAGVGIENIFKIVRIDAVWRLTHKEPRITGEDENFAVNISLHFDF